MIDPEKYWWPLATSAELGTQKPLARTLLALPLVIFRDATNTPAILIDRCPHRHAPLSDGSVHQGEVQCPYHGWRFNDKGHCTEVPGLISDTGCPQLIRSVASREAHGLVWACLLPDKLTPEPVPPSVTDNCTDGFFMVDSIDCSIVEAAENFLDGSHTHFVHAGWIRHDKKRQNVRAQIRKLANGIEAQYSGEDTQSGLISRLFEGTRTKSIGRFRLPGIAELEYHGENGLNLLVTTWFTPENNNRLRIHARVATVKGLTPRWIKERLLRYLFNVILNQDKRILEQTHNNITKFNNSRQLDMKVELLDSPLDLLGPSIRHLVNGKKLHVVEKNIIVQL